MANHSAALENLRCPSTMPLFRCHGCNMRIERSMATYWRNKGKVLCSSCLDSQETSGSSPQPPPLAPIPDKQENDERPSF